MPGAGFSLKDIWDRELKEQSPFEPIQLGPPALLGRFYPRQGLGQGLQSSLWLPRLAVCLGHEGKNKGASQLGPPHTLMRRQSVADFYYPLGTVSLHGQRPPPQGAPLFTPDCKPLLKGKAHQGFGMRVGQCHLPTRGWTWKAAGQRSSATCKGDTSEHVSRHRL
jgi:hypothetical protein